MGIFSDEKYRPSESRILATALTFSAGFIDAYTYIQRGHTLSAGQTGNVIFFASAFADHNIAGMLNRATTFIAFTLGLLLVGLFHKYVKSNYWRVFCLFPILFICLGVGFVPKNVPNYYVVPVIAFGLAVQNASFSKIEGMGYNNALPCSGRLRRRLGRPHNAFTTGNLKKSVVAWSAYFFGEDKSQHNAAVNYMFLVIAFALGAIVSALLQKIFVLKTIWFAVLLLGAINIVYTISLNKRKKLSFSKNE